MMQVDEFEPQMIETLISQVLQDTLRVPLNRNGYADYLWHLANNSVETAERKQVHEILSNMEGVEAQLMREYAVCQNLILIIENVCKPTATGCQEYVLSENGRFYRPAHEYRMPYARFEAWKIGLERVGILVWPTSDRVATATALVQLARSAAQSEHKALHRYLKQRPPFHPNLQVQLMMAIPGIGPEKAEAAIEVYGTLYKVLSQTVDNLATTIPGWGIGTAKAVLKAVGREE